jgi:SNF2 family DNA or RNA helicase
MRTKPLKHQKNIIPVVEENKNYALLWDMGTGKTWVGCYLIEKYFDDNEKYLIISPNSVTDTWYNQIFEHTELEEWSVNIIRGNAKKKKKLLEQSVISVINYEALANLKDVLTKTKYKIIIADESHKIKNHKAQMTKVALSLKSERKYMLTGTPVSKNYLDFFSQFKFMDGGETFGKSFFAFRAKYFIDENVYNFKCNFPNWVLKSGQETVLNEKLAKKSHRLEKKDVLELPDKIYSNKYCFLTKEQNAAYKDLKEECITILNDNTITAQVALTKIIRLTQITSGFLKAIDNNIIKFANNPKLNLCKELVEEILCNKENKLILWAHYVNDIETLQREFKQFNPVCIKGGTTKRGELVEKFQNDESCRLFIANPQAAAEGITLTRANYAIRYSYDFNYINFKQAEDRNHRKGSEIHNKITYINLVAKDTIDELIISSLDDKNTTSQEILEFIKKNN